MEKVDRKAGREKGHDMQEPGADSNPGLCCSLLTCGPPAEMSEQFRDCRHGFYIQTPGAEYSVSLL